MEASKEFVRCREEKEKKEGGVILNHVFFAEVLTRGKREMGEVVWIESETKEVFNNLVSLKKCLVGRWEAPSSHLLILDFLKSWAQYSGGLKGELHLCLLGGTLI